MKNGGDSINNKIGKIMTLPTGGGGTISKQSRERNMYINDYTDHQHWLQTQPIYVCNYRVFHLKTVFSESIQ